MKWRLVKNYTKLLRKSLNKSKILKGKEESENMIIKFDFSTSNFNHAVDVCEVAFGYEGEAWELVKNSGSMEELAEFLEADGVGTFTFVLPPF